MDIAGNRTALLRISVQQRICADPAIAAVSTFLTLAAPVIMVLFGRTLRQRQSSGLKER